MSALRELQMAFGDAVIHGGAIPEIRDTRPGRAARLAIYRNNFYANLTEALRATFPVVEKLVGTEFFAHAARQYIRSFPSTTGNLHDFGNRFAEFLAVFPAAAGLPYLGDVARLEWAWHEVFHARASESMKNLTALQAIPDSLHGNICFSLNAATRLVRSDFPILRIWQVNQSDYSGDDHVSLAEGACQLLVIQSQAVVDLHALSPGEYLLLHSFASQLDLQTAYATALEPEPEFDLVSVLPRHLQLGTLASWSIRDDH